MLLRRLDLDGLHGLGIEVHAARRRHHVAHVITQVT